MPRVVVQRVQFGILKLKEDCRLQQSLCGILSLKVGALSNRFVIDVVRYACQGGTNQYAKVGFIENVACLVKLPN